MSIATVIAFIIRYRKWLAYAAGVIAVLLALWAAYSAIWQSGYDEADAKWKDAQRAAEAKAQADSWTLVGDINAIDATVAKTVETIRYVPRDKPRTVAVEIARDLPCLHVPDRLLDATNQYTRDLAAAAGHRVIPVPSPDAAGGR